MVGFRCCWLLWQSPDEGFPISVRGDWKHEGNWKLHAGAIVTSTMLRRYFLPAVNLVARWTQDDRDYCPAVRAAAAFKADRGPTWNATYLNHTTRRLLAFAPSVCVCLPVPALFRGICCGSEGQFTRAAHTSAISLHGDTGLQLGRDHIDLFSLSWQERETSAFFFRRSRVSQA